MQLPREETLLYLDTRTSGATGPLVLAPVEGVGALWDPCICLFCVSFCVFFSSYFSFIFFFIFCPFVLLYFCIFVFLSFCRFVLNV